MYKIAINPDAANYTTKDGKEVVAVQLDGGAGRYRRDIIGATSLVTAQWTVDAYGFQYLRAFFNTGTKKGSLPFKADLLLDQGGVLTEHICYFVPETFSLSQQQGNGYIVVANLEVKPLPVDEVADDGILLFYGTEIITTEDATEFFNLLEHLVEVDLPGAVT